MAIFGAVLPFLFAWLSAKWLASKLKPKRYGDKITTEHAGSLGLTDMSEETLDAKLAELLKSQ